MSLVRVTRLAELLTFPRRQTNNISLWRTSVTSLAQFRSILTDASIARMTASSEKRNIIIIGSPPSASLPSRRVGTDTGINMQAAAS